MQTIGIIGGTFDPIHNGHLLPALEVAEYFQFSKLLLLPLGVAVHRDQPQASSEQRLNMCRLAAESYSIIDVDDREIRRGGQSYSVITLEELRQEYGEEQSFCWLMGRDAIDGFTQWKDWQRILELAHIVVMQRPGYDWERPLPEELQPYNADTPPWMAVGRATQEQLPKLEGVAGSIVLKTVQQQAISSTEIRKKLADGEFVQGDLPENVRKYIFEQQLYGTTNELAAPSNNETPMTFDELKPLVINALEDLKVAEITEVDVRGKTTMTDLMLVAVGTSSRHVKSLANNVVMECKQAGVMPIGVEGERDGEWVLVDLGDIVVHVMQPQVRDYYNIEKLWEVDASTLEQMRG